MDDVSFLKKTNISAIYRFDQQVKDIIISASQVALYVFDAKKTKWIKRKVEGACFFYKRKTSPKYGIFILNRLDTTNFIELLNSTMEIQIQEPFVLYRNIFKTIFGIWFYDKTECLAMANVFQQILQELKDEEKADQDEDNVEPNSMLEQSAVKSDANSNERRPSGQPESVRQFFAIASNQATKNQPNLQQSPAQHANCKKSLSSSFQTVGHIEKKQTLPINRKFGELHGNESDYDKNVSVIENNMKCLNVSGNLTKSSPVTILDGVDQKFLQSPACGDSQATEFPELIPPRMLITPLDLTNSVKSFEAPVSSSDCKNSKIDLMSKNQMIQAMEYLLKNDSQFVDKLYDAYLKISKN